MLIDLGSFCTFKHKHITWYSCGPTIYDVSHMGYARYTLPLCLCAFIFLLPFLSLCALGPTLHLAFFDEFCLTILVTIFSLS